MIIGAFLAYGIYYVIAPDEVARIMAVTSSYFNVYYIQQVVFLAFAILYPDVQVLLMFRVEFYSKYGFAAGGNRQVSIPMCCYYQLCVLFCDFA